MERASNAERRLLERSDEDEIRRTLVLAQRTAVASMEEARVEADRMVSETDARCRHMVAEAEAQAARLDADIATRRRLELGDLAEQRAALQLDIDHLRVYLDDERTRLGDVLRAQVEWIEGGYALSEMPSLSDVAPPTPLLPPAPAEVRAPEAIEPPVAVDEPVEPEAADVEDVDAFAPPVAADAEPAASAVDDLRLAREELADALRRAGVDSDDADERVDEPAASSTPDPAPLQLEPQLPRAAPFDDRSVGDVTGSFDVVADQSHAEEADEEEEEADAPRWRDEGEDDDPFLAELRRAVVDTEPLGPRDHHDDPAPPGYAEGELSPGGFFRRGRRRD
jgi:hypothetical protein